MRVIHNGLKVIDYQSIGLINREKKLSFKFNGKKYFGYEGDTLSICFIGKWSSFSW